MKVESGGVVASPLTASLHRIKVKEEDNVAEEASVNDRRDRLLKSALSIANKTGGSSSSAATSVRGGTFGAIATITISSGSAVTGGGCAPASDLAAAAAAVVAGKRPRGDHDDDHALPVDLDTKTMNRGPPSSSQPRDRVQVNEPNGVDSRGCSPSPSASPSSVQPKPSSAPSTECEESSMTLCSLKTEAPDDGPSQQRQEEPNGTARCISGVFAAHGKLRRLLGTLVQFAMDMSPEVGDSVRSLVLGLLSGSMSAEEFHSALQDATNFPLRGFVLPYLKHCLPSLQRDLNAAARADNQSCAQYLRSNEPAVLEAVGLGSGGASGAEGSVEFFAEHASSGPPAATPKHHYPAMRSAGTTAHTPATAGPQLAYSHASKRRASEALSYYENGTVFDEGLPYAKRPLANPWSSHHHQHAPNHQYHHQPTQQQLPHQQHHPGDIPYCWYSTPNQHPHSIIPSLMQPGYPGAPLPHQQPAIAHTATSAGAPAGHQPSSLAQNGSSSLEDEWKNIHVMLNCILGMVDKTKRALAILQKRGCTSPASSSSSSTANGGNHQATNGGGPAPSNGSLDCGEGTFKRLSGEIVAQTIRATEDRVAEVKRRAEEAVQEVKRAAVAEVQRAVAAAMAESRANERLRGQRYLEGPQQPRTGQKHGRPGPFLRLADARTAPGAPTTTTGDEPDKDAHHSGAVATGCWNCGRQALETCGGCGVARYCGSFCQHRDWEAGGHHATCSSTKANGPAAGQQQQDRARSSTPSPPRAASAASDSDPASNKPTSTIRVTK